MARTQRVAVGIIRERDTRPGNLRGADSSGERAGIEDGGTGIPEGI